MCNILNIWFSHLRNKLITENVQQIKNIAFVLSVNWKYLLKGAMAKSQFYNPSMN